MAILLGAWALALLAAVGREVAAKENPPGLCLDEVVTVNIQPLTVVEVVPVVISTYVPHVTDLVIDEDLTCSITKVPTVVNTVMTKTCTRIVTQTW